MQAAVKIVLEPVFEADFLPCSFGFRPERSQQDALQVLIDEWARGRRWVVETDIARKSSYQERWEFESSLDEIKTHQRGRSGVLRSLVRAMATAMLTVVESWQELKTWKCVWSTGSGQERQDRIRGEGTVW